jgi:hypothetical protein
MQWNGFTARLRDCGIVETAIQERRAGTIFFGSERHYFSTMNSTLMLTPPATFSRTANREADAPAAKKVVLLLGFSPDIRQQPDEGGKKNRADIRPPVRWGIND